MGVLKTFDYDASLVPRPMRFRKTRRWFHAQMDACHDGGLLHPIWRDIDVEFRLVGTAGCRRAFQEALAAQNGIHPSDRRINDRAR